MFGGKETKKQLEEVSNSSNFLGKGTIVTGNLESYGNIRVEGKIIGNVKTKAKLAMGESSYLEGNILAQNADIAGHVKGIIEVSELLTLKATAIVTGDIIANKLAVEPGATFNGNSKMGAIVREISINEELPTVKLGEAVVS
jgi:cytoskeletal protein CcmA (bactofilin family)